MTYYNYQNEYVSLQDEPDQTWSTMLGQMVVAGLVSFTISMTLTRLITSK